MSTDGRLACASVFSITNLVLMFGMYDEAKLRNPGSNILQFRRIPFMVHLMLFWFKWVVMRIGSCLFLQSITLLAVIYLIFNLVYLSAFTFYLHDPTSNNIILCDVHMLDLKI